MFKEIINKYMKIIFCMEDKFFHWKSIKNPLITRANKILMS